MKYKTALFDFDGTLFDTGPGVMRSVQYAARAFGYNADDIDELRCFVGPPLKTMFMKKYEVSSFAADLMIEKYRERYSGVGLTECSPYAGVKTLVAELREAGLNVAVATGKPTVFTMQILEMNGMANAFDCVLGSEFDGRRSQKREVVAELLERFGADGAVMIGDRDNDVLGAAACHIPCIGVGWGYAEAGELETAGAICVVENTDELKNILLG